MASDAKKWTAVSGAIVGGLAASACCVLPLVLLWLGISGAWTANLTALAEYNLWFLSSALLMLGLSYRLIFSNSKNKCDDGKMCAKRLPQRLVKSAFWMALILIIVAAAFPYAVSLYYGV